jgi:putative colanic acid biosynthesis acetyltransferase WcaF
MHRNKTNLAVYDNSWYQPGSTLKRFSWLIISGLFFEVFIPFPNKLKIAFLRLFGAKVGKGTVIKPFVKIKYPWFLEIGEQVWIGEHVWIDNLVRVSIGSNACLSQGCMLLTGNHDFTKPTFDLIAKPITLEEGVWIGAKATVCSGVTCYSHSVLAVGSVLTKDMTPYQIYQGIPAVCKRERPL